MKALYLLQTVVSDAGELAADQEHEFDDAEAERLLALGVGIDPALRVVDSLPDTVSVISLQDAVAAAKAEAAAEIEALTAKLDDAAAALKASHAEIDALTAKLDDAAAALKASHAEIDALTKALAAAEKKAK